MHDLLGTIWLASRAFWESIGVQVLDGVSSQNRRKWHGFTKRMLVDMIELET